MPTPDLKTVAIEPDVYDQLGVLAEQAGCGRGEMATICLNYAIPRVTIRTQIVVDFGESEGGDDAELNGKALNRRLRPPPLHRRTGVLKRIKEILRDAGGPLNTFQIRKEYLERHNAKLSSGVTTNLNNSKDITRHETFPITYSLNEDSPEEPSEEP